MTVHTAALYRSGQNNDLLLVNDELLFRFPKYPQGIAAQRRELAVLNAVRPQLPLTTPQFVSFLENADHFAFANVLRHGDFGTSNILYSAGQKRVVGIIDFGHVGIGDPAIDFAGQCVSYGEPFLRRCARAYPLIDLCWERIRFYAGCAFLLEDALFCTENDTDEADEVIAEVNQSAIHSG